MTAPSRPPRAGHLPALTGLRFFLAMWVVFSHLVGKGHAFEPLAQWLPLPLGNIMHRGYLAVTTFFVLSGFVLARTYSATKWNRVTLVRYGVGRLARVYPVYLLSLLIVSPFIVAAHAASKAWLVVVHLLLIQGWMATNFPVGWNTPAWTLSVEMFFYLMFPLVLVPMRGAGWRKSLAAAALACVLTRALYRLGVPDGMKPLIHFSDFLMGIAASCVYDLIASRPKPPSGAWLYIPGCLASATLIAYPELLPNWADLNSSLRPINGLLLIGFGMGGGWIARALSTRPIVYLGKASYALYILHIPILWWAVSWRMRYAPEIYVAFVILVAAVVYGLFEEPANRYIRKLV